MRGRELPFVLLALVLCQATRGPAAPVPAAGETVLAKMYPRGNHWAVAKCLTASREAVQQHHCHCQTHDCLVNIRARGCPSGHLMGKKSTGESPDVHEGGSVKHQLREYILWEEAARNLLSLVEGKGTRSHQPPPRGVPQYSPVHSGLRG